MPLARTVVPTLSSSQWMPTASQNALPDLYLSGFLVSSLCVFPFRLSLSFIFIHPLIIRGVFCISQYFPPLLKCAYEL